MENLPTLISIGISAGVAFAAIISPILTALINNTHQTKIEKMELEHDHYEKTVTYQRNIFENYLRITGHYIGSEFKDYEDQKKYNDAYLSILLYTPDELKSLLVNANKFIIQKDLKQSLASFELIATKIRDHLNTL